MDTFLNIPCSVHIMLLVCLRDEHLALDKQLVCSFLGMITSPAPSFLQLPTVLCISMVLFYWERQKWGAGIG